MGVSFAELRQRCQLPVRHNNDVAGLLFGDRFSLPITKLFVDRRWSPDIATIGMLIAGLSGALLQLPSWPWAPVAGAALLLLYYLFDCVDGEVARFRGIENMKWGYYDYIFHLLVKPSCFLGLGFGLYFESGRGLYLGAAALAAVATLWLKLFLEIPGILFLKCVLAGKPGNDRSFQTFYKTLQHSLGAGPSVETKERFRLKLDLTTLRALATNFDISLILLLLATVLDQTTTPWHPFDSWRGTWLCYYGLVLPLDFLDYLRTYLVRGHFSAEMRRLLTLAHHFQLEPPSR